MNYHKYVFVATPVRSDVDTAHQSTDNDSGVMTATDDIVMTAPASVPTLSAHLPTVADSVSTDDGGRSDPASTTVPVSERSLTVNGIKTEPRNVTSSSTAHTSSAQGSAGHETHKPPTHDKVTC